MKAKEVTKALNISRIRLRTLVRNGLIIAVPNKGKKQEGFDYDEKSVMEYLDGQRKTFRPVNQNNPEHVGVLDIKSERLKWLYDLYSAGIDIGPEKKIELIKQGYIREKVTNIKINDGTVIRSIDKITEELYKIERQKKRDWDNLAKRDEIPTAQWMPLPDEVNNYPVDFIQWIDSINSGFLNRIQYKRFENYVMQSKIWMAQQQYYEKCTNKQDRWDFVVTEKNRIKQNTLYFIDKYVKFKDEKAAGGARKYISYEAQQILCFLVDSGYNLALGKGRQIFFTTTMGAIAIKFTNFHRSHFIKFITHNQKKGEEIFEDKIKFSFYSLEQWIKCTVSNDRDGLFKISRKIDGVKGTRGGADSKIMVGTPNENEINGGSPNKILIDEVGMIGNLSSLINEILPTLYSQDPILKKQVLSRQLIYWGTGGSMDKGGDAFEVEFRTALDMWEKRNFANGIVPVFFDFFARPGVDRKYYDDQKETYYQKSRLSGDIKHRVQFHQHNPLTIDDMFLRSAETIVPLDVINNEILRIRALPIAQKPQYGYFEPIFDTNTKLTGFVPFKIIGANFIPTPDADDRVTSVIYNHPEKRWKYRYYKGTDPVFAKSGHSKFSSAIWDKKLQTVSACLNHRTHDYRETYLQSLLMSIYYEMPQELVEFNIGGEYINMVSDLGYFNSLIPQTLLPEYLQMNSSEPIGIGKKASTSRYIINKQLEMLQMHMKNICIEEYFIQLKTFVRKTTNSGVEVFKVDDPTYYYDDVIDAVTYAYIASICFTETPLNMMESASRATQMRYVCDKSTGWNTRLMPVEVPFR